MDLIIDASSVINLDNAQALEGAASLHDRNFCLSPLVIGECQPTCAGEIMRLQQADLITFVDPNETSAELFLTLLADYDLGEGETECLALSLTHPYTFCCDDEKARRVGTELIGTDRVVGSLRLLKWMVADGHITAAEAFALYEAMTAGGGFLPVICVEWFEQA